MLCRQLHAFGHHQQAHGMSQLNDGFNKLRALAVFAQRFNKGLVNFQSMHRQIVQIGQGRIACPEIIQGQQQAARPQTPQFFNVFGHFFNQNAFRDFQFQLLDADASLGNAFVHELYKTIFHQLACRNIDSYSQVALPIRRQASGKHASFFKDPTANRHNPTALLCKGDKHIRRNQALFGVHPAQQRFKADYSAITDSNLLLIKQAQFANFQGLPQPGSQPNLLIRLGQQRPFVKTPAIAPGALGRIHGQIPFAQQFFHILAVFRIQDNAHAGGKAQFACAHFIIAI